MERTVRLLYYSFRSDVSTQALRDYLTKFADMLIKPPLSLTLRLQELTSSQVAPIFANLNPDESFPYVAGQVGLELGKLYKLPKTIFLCHEHHLLARAALRPDSNPCAKWGAHCGPIAAVYGNTDKRVVWHESLHLFGADDCYDEKKPDDSVGPTCALTNCIMRYNPTLSDMGQWPILCDKNVSKVVGATW